MAPLKTKRKSQHLPNSNYLSEVHLTIKSRTMVEHRTENSKDLSEEIQISGGGGGCLQRQGMISFKLVGTLPFKWNLVGKRTIFGLWKMKFYFFVILVFSHIIIILKFVWMWLETWGAIMSFLALKCHSTGCHKSSDYTGLILSQRQTDNEQYSNTYR